MMKIWASLLGILLCCSAPAYAGSSNSLLEKSVVYQPLLQQAQELPVVLRRLAEADVVYLAETHDRASDHRTQAEIIRALYQLRPNLTIAMEMFQRPYQGALDLYLVGRLTETELLQRTQYQKRWGYPWEFYAPILQFAKEKHLSVVALNTPTEVTRKVARLGLGKLTVVERQWIPPKSAIVLGPEAYRQRIRQVFEQVHHGKSNSANFETFFLAQVLWDETMAEQIARALAKRPNTLVVVLAGQGHILYGDGIPKRVARRMNGLRSRPLAQRSVLLNPSKDLQADPSGAIADYFWLNQP